jgi:hypothetical protein
MQARRERVRGKVLFGGVAESEGAARVRCPQFQ